MNQCDEIMNKFKREASECRELERKRLLAFTEEQSWDLPPHDWYQRIRFLREIEGAKLLKELNSNLAPSSMNKTYIEFRTD